MKIEIDEKYIGILSAALGELPYKVAAPLVADINRQIFERQTDARKRLSYYNSSDVLTITDIDL